MNIIETIKNVLQIADSLENTELKRQLLEIENEALELNNQNRELQKRIDELEKQADIDSKIERHHSPYITLKDDPQHIPYCANCWALKHKLVQLNPDGEKRLDCYTCRMSMERDSE